MCCLMAMGFEYPLIANYCGFHKSVIESQYSVMCNFTAFVLPLSREYSVFSLISPFASSYIMRPYFSLLASEPWFNQLGIPTVDLAWR